jgi:hypothetical protein
MNRILSSIAVANILFLTTACRTGARQNVEGAMAINLEVTAFGVSKSPAKDPTYELSGCSDPVNATTSDGNKITFQAVGITKGATCNLSLKGTSFTSQLKFFAEQNVLFQSKGFEIKSDTSGQLVATAIMQQTYAVQSNNAATLTLTVPVIFPAEESAPPIIGKLECGANYNVANLITKSSSLEGRLELTSPAEKQALECKRMIVSANNGKNLYIAELQMAPIQTTGLSQTIELPAITLKRVYDPESVLVNISVQPE